MHRAHMNERMTTYSTCAALDLIAQQPTCSCTCASKNAASCSSCDVITCCSARGLELAGSRKAAAGAFKHLWQVGAYSRLMCTCIILFMGYRLSGHACTE
jgi:hypothetical protein